jgi:hypothetical protein
MMQPIPEDTLDLVEDVMRGIAVPPYEGWLGETVATLCTAVRTLQTERAADIQYAQAQKDQAWEQGQKYRGTGSYSGWGHWEGQRLAYADMLLRLTAEPPGPTTPLLILLAELSQEMPDYD